MNNVRLLFVTCLLLAARFAVAQHPLTFFTSTEATTVRKGLNQSPLLSNSFSEIKKEVDAWIGKDVDVPVPKDPAGGYTHDKHKANYTLIFNAGVLYNLTGDVRYAKLVKDVLLKYARLNPTLKNHPEATSSSPGRIFWQALNDANWLVFAGMAYDLAYNGILPADRKTIETGAFKPEVDFITQDLKPWFNLIHNHGVWACAGVGIAGIATNNKEWVDMALYGSDKKGNTGFLAQMRGLFSPDGYYTEGPYYVRYAILPYYLFANALQHARPELKIFSYRDSILSKALQAGLQQTNTNGAFMPLNDALKEKDYTSNELVTAIDIAWSVYGANDALLYVAARQNRVLLNKGGAAIAARIASGKNLPAYFPYRTVEYKDGKNGDEGGVSFLRSGSAKNLTTLFFKYPSHGLSHGHFDKLTFGLYDKGNEIFTDYGSVRFIGIEQKYGGRYLPENKSYASQTIAHSTMVVDETSDFGGKEDVAEKYHADKLFSVINDPAAQVVAAEDVHSYPGVGLQRTLYLLQLPNGRRLMVDLFHARSADEHQYDLPFQYDGQVIHTSFNYHPNTGEQVPLGKKNGYQFLWKEAEASVADTVAQFTFLNHRTYYSISSLIRGTASIFFTRSGANDPDFNLRREPAYIIRQRGKDQLFVNVVEIHGNFDPINEFSTNATPAVQGIQVLQDNEEATIVSIMVNGKELKVCQANKNFEQSATHTISGTTWSGPCQVWYDGKKL